MAVMLIFVITGVVAAVFIEKKHFYVALVCHAVLFTVMLVLLSFMPDFEPGLNFWSRLLGKDASPVSAAIYGTGDTDHAVIFVLIMLELLLILQTAAVSFAVAHGIRELANRLHRSPDYSLLLAKRRAVQTVSPKIRPAERRYLTLCRCLC